MSSRARFALVVVLATSLTGIGVWGFAQVRPNAVTPVIISGSDVGFRVEGHNKNLRTGDDVAIGQLVVRIDGQWVDAQVEGRGMVRPASH